MFFQLGVVMSLKYIRILKETGFTLPERGGFNNNGFESEETLLFRIWQGRLLGLGKRRKRIPRNVKSKSNINS